MTPEEKQQLIKDLCAREPYHPRIRIFNQGYEGFQDGEFDTDLWLHHIDAFRFARIEILPYLRPLSSMTEEEQRTLDSMCNGVEMVSRMSGLKMFDKAFDWLNANHFNFRLPEHLVLEPKEGMYETRGTSSN